MNLFESLTAPILDAFAELTADDVAFVPPPKIEMGDIAMRAFDAAKKLRMPPAQIAARVAQEVTFGPEVREVSAAGPYVNFRLDRAAFAARIVAAVRAEGAAYGSNHSGRGRRVLIEHTSINPNASPHVGRARCAMIGDTLVRLLRFEDYDVETHYYVNDMGRQIGLLVLVCDDIEHVTFDEILDRYVRANNRAEHDPEFAEQGYALLAKMEERDPDTMARFRAVTDLCLDGQLAVLGRLGVAFDIFDRESSYIQDPRIEEVLDALRAKEALFTDEEQRLVVDLAKIGHERDEGRYFVLMRANGSSMYGYRDLAYAIDKSARGADVNLIVLGEDHKLYAEQLERILGAANKAFAEAVYYSYILLREGKMSTRQGKVVLLADFLNEAAARALEKVREQCKDLDADEQQAIAEQVAVSAIRFAVLRISPNKNVIFDWESSLSFTGDTGPYVQYSCARINSILRKLGDTPEATPEAFPTETDAEWALVLKLAAFPEVVAGAVRQRNGASIAQFALETARLFTSFYHDCPVINADSDSQRIARAQLCDATRTVLQNALGILGIAAPERM
ncbi:MAG TPA: arginine--tRNA ligase [Candidatus Hydrogenedentes bacterium]|nr:arginine--tRNA ligase [Candidatus Hydrogenedentota bacterium]HPG66388.1 arginine--tRNA ligase [Candidatus Hydrogenedentota bacterium]